MSRHFATTMVQCPRCGEETKLTYAAVSTPTKIRFSHSIRCESCSVAEEGDGPALTADARAAFIAAEGRWSAHIRDLGPRRAEALRALRELRKESPVDLLQTIRDGKAIAEGALVEVEYFQDALQNVGAVVTLTRVS